MKCYNCGAKLTEKDFCTNCGADVSRYKKLISFSNYYYNEGLSKANVRDLSGAVESLRQCLAINKNHIAARNLLGLVYFEMGEQVAALSEWVISKNLRPNKNIADDYLNTIQKSPAQLEAINQKSNKDLRSFSSRRSFPTRPTTYRPIFCWHFCIWRRANGSARAASWTAA